MGPGPAPGAIFQRWPRGLQLRAHTQLAGMWREAPRNSEDGEQQRVRHPGKARAMRSWCGSRGLAESRGHRPLCPAPRPSLPGASAGCGEDSASPFHMNALRTPLCFSFFLVFVCLLLFLSYYVLFCLFVF
ncbi:hypothetical protein ACRRTK_024458 [Alexandromys fortis]